MHQKKVHIAQAPPKIQQIAKARARELLAGDGAPVGELAKGPAVALRELQALAVEEELVAVIEQLRLRIETHAGIRQLPAPAIGGENHLRLGLGQVLAQKARNVG